VTSAGPGGARGVNAAVERTRASALGVVGRGPELAKVRAFLTAAPGGGAGLVLEGEPGIGKTTLWREGVEVARSGPARVLTCRAAEAESSLPLTALCDLLGAVADEAMLHQLPDPQARALRIALLREDPEGASLSQRALAQAVLELLRMLSSQGPLLVAIDDVHWLDPSSSGVLAYVLRRLGDEPISVLASLRPALDEPRGSRRLSEWTSLETVAHVRLGPLSLGALHQLVRERLGLVLTRPVVARLTQASGGNPFYALEIGRLLVEQGGDVAGLGISLPIPRDLRQIVVARIAGLPEAAREAVLATFALTHPTEELIEADLRLAGLAADGLDQAMSAQALERSAGRIGLAHPLVGSAPYAELTTVQRRSLHGRLAQLASDPVERARHLALSTSGPDAGVAASLDEAAEWAAARAAPEATAELLELAVQLTPASDVDARLRRLDRSALAHHVAGDSQKAVSQWEEIAGSAPSGVLRAQAVWRLAEYGSSSVPGGFESAPELLQSVIGEASADPRLHVDVLASLSELLLWGRGPRAAEPHAVEAVRLATPCPDARARMHALITRALVAYFSGDGSRVSDLDEAIALESDELDVPIEIRPSTYRAYMLAWSCDELPEAARQLEGKLDHALRDRDEASMPMLLWHACEVAVSRGDLDAAASYATWCRDAVAASGRAGREGAALYCQALVEAHRGRAEEALALARHALELDEPRGVLYLVTLFRGLLGFIELSAGRHRRALDWMQPMHRLLDEAGYAEPAVFRFVPDEVEALVCLSRLDEADAVLEPFERAAERLGRRSALAGTARCRGLISAAAGDADAAVAELDRAVLLETDLGRLFEEARARLALGAAARRARHRGAADEALRSAGELFLRVGAPTWAERAVAERGRIGLRPPAAGVLTETDRRITAMVAAGHANPEIARSLFMSRKTVEAHLSAIYRKLGIGSRAELAARAGGLLETQPDKRA